MTVDDEVASARAALVDSLDLVRVAAGQLVEMTGIAVFAAAQLERAESGR